MGPIPRSARRGMDHQALGEALDLSGEAGHVLERVEVDGIASSFGSAVIRVPCVRLGIHPTAPRVRTDNARAGRTRWRRRRR
jgi:hypothetical protein